MAEEIKAEALELQQTIKADGVVATYSKGRGYYDYEALASHLEPDYEIIQQFTITRVDWRKVVDALEPLDDLKAKFYKPGKPYVSLKLKAD